MFKVAACKLPVAVAFVKVMPCKSETPATVSLVVDTLLDEIFGTAKEVVPVADVKVMPARSDNPETVNLDDETLVDDTLPTSKLPARYSVPVADTLNCVVELVWKSRKLPPKDVGLIPMYVPEAESPF